MRLVCVRTCAEPLLRRLSIACVLIAALPSCGGNSKSSSSVDWTSITVQPTSPSMPAGAQLQFGALGTPASGGSIVVTSEATWTSSNPAVATINSAGLATGVAAGKTQITASLGSIVGSSTLSVTGAIENLQQITITPADSELTVSATLQLASLGTYSDGTTGSLTSSVSWKSSAPSVATVSQSGLVTGGTATGSTVITATLGTVTESTTVTVVQ